MPQGELFEERASRPVQQRTSKALTAPNDIDQSALVKRLENRARTDAADFLDLRATNWLPVRDDCQRLQRGCRQSLWPRSQLRALNGFGVFRPGQDLPAAGDLNELHSVTILFIMHPQFFQRGFEGVVTVLRVRSHNTQGVDGNGYGAREERRFKQLR